MRRLRVIGLLVVISIFIFGSAQAGTVTGMVTSDNGARGLGGIGVGVYSEKCNFDSELDATTTAPDGSYTLGNLPDSAVFVEFIPQFTNKNFIGGFYTGSGVSGDCAEAASVDLSDPSPTIVDADLSYGPEPIMWVSAGVYNGRLSVDFGVYAAFRELVTAATVVFPSSSGRPDYAFGLDYISEGGDRLIWDSPCRFLDLWTHDFGTVTENDYGTYTLTVTFDNTYQVVWTSVLNAPSNENGAVAVDENTIYVAVKSDGSVDVNWDQGSGAVGLGQSYQVRVREVDTNREVARIKAGSDPNTQSMSDELPAEALQCLEVGQEYKWLVRAYDAGGQHSATRFVTATYNPDELGGRAADSQVYAWKGGGILFDLAVREGAIETVTAASVSGPAIVPYNFDISFNGSDWYDGSTETRRFLKSWSHFEGLTPVAGAEYQYSVTFADGHVENFARSLPEVIPELSPPDGLSAQIRPDGAITFWWDVPPGSENNKFQVRIRDLNGKEYYKSDALTGGDMVTASFQDLQAMVPGRQYMWFVRHWDPSFQVMQESQRIQFYYDPWGINYQNAPGIPISEGYSLPEGQFLYVANEGYDGAVGTTIVKIDATGRAQTVGTGFNGPSGLAIHPENGHLFISDDRDGVYEVEPDSTIKQVLEAIQFSNPNALAFDASGRLIVAEGVPGGRIIRVALDSETPTTLAEGFNSPQGVTAIGDDVFFTDNDGYVYKIDGSDSNLPKTPQTVDRHTSASVVSGTDGGLTSDGTHLIAAAYGKVISIYSDGSTSTVFDLPSSQPRGVAYAPATNTVFISQFDNYQVLDVELGTGTPEPQIFSGPEQLQLDGPYGLVVSSTDFGDFVSPLYSDADNDGVAGPEDAFPEDPAASVDTDGDGMPDDWNPGKSEADSTSDPVLVLDNDDDNDGVPDIEDNCPTSYMEGADQSDWNGDGIGDMCDPNIWQLGIAGQITSSVWQPGHGDVYVIVADGPDPLVPGTAVWGRGRFNDSAPFDYTVYLWNGAPGNQAFMFAFWDANGNADPDNPMPDAGDYVGEFASNPATLVAPGLAGVNLVIEEAFNPAEFAALNASVMNVHTSGGMLTFYDVEVWGYNGDLQPADIDSYTIVGPGINKTYTGEDIENSIDDIEFDPSYNGIWLSVPGSPQVGEFTFTVTIGGVALTGTDVQHINRALPLPGGFNVTEGTVLTSKTPIFYWDAVSGVTGTDISYRFQIRDADTRQLVVNTPRISGMLHYVVPTGRLAPDNSYQYRVRVTDSDEWLDVQNRSHNDWISFGMSGQLNHLQPPSFMPDWGAVTWNTDGGAPLLLSITIRDADGIAGNRNDGSSSHSVKATLPNDEGTVTLGFDGSSSNGEEAYFYTMVSSYSPGTYTFEVTDPDGNTATSTDTLEGSVLDLPVEASITPSLINPHEEGISASFDNVRINNALYDSFESCTNCTPDGSKWNWWGNGLVNIGVGELNLSTLPNVGRGDATVAVLNPGAVNAVSADVTIKSISSDSIPRARISGYWFNLDGYDVFASISVRKNRINYSVSIDYKEETYNWDTLDNGFLKGSSIGTPVNIGIEWDGSQLVFHADNETATYTPIGTILPARYPEKNLQVRTHLVTSVTPTFSWDAVTGASEYRVRIYSYDNSRTILKQWVSGNSFTVPHGALRPSAYYRFRLDAIDAAHDADPDNYSRTPASGGEFYRFYTGLPGDVNGDGFVDLGDAIGALKGATAQSGIRLYRSGDVNADEQIGGAEALYILQDAAGLR